MKSHNIVIYLIIPLALFSTLSLFDNVEAQTNSTTANQTTSQQQPQNQNANLTAQALMKVDIFELKDTLMKAKLAIVDENFKEALTDVSDVELQLLPLEPSPTKFLSVLHNAIKTIDSSDINKSLDILTRIQVTILKAENQIFKAAVADPQMIQQFDTMNKLNINDEEEEEDYEKERIQQFINNEKPNTEE